MMRARLTMMVVAVAAFAAACGGGGGNGSSPITPPVPNPSATAIASQTGSPAAGNTAQAVKFSLSIPLASTNNATLRRRNFVSSATNGASISVTGPNSASASAVVDLSSTSTACTTNGATRTCTVNMTVPLGADTFTIKTYNQAPVNGVIPAGAQELGIGSASATISSTTSSIAISIGGLIANLGALPAFASLPADGSTHQVPIILAPTDFGDQPIVAGTSDPYANPIAVSISESGGSGHTVLLKNGVASGTNVTLNYSTDTVTLQYDGGGAPGYSAILSASATGAATTSTTIGPMFAAATGLSADTLTLTAPGTPVTVTITEAGAPPSRQYSAGASSACSGVATATSANGGGGSATFTVTGTTTPSLGACTILISDGTNFLTLAVTNSPPGNSPTPTPSPTPTATPVGTPTPTPTPAGGSGGPIAINGYTLTVGPQILGSTLAQIVSGPNNSMWYASNGGGLYGSVTAPTPYPAATPLLATTSFSVGGTSSITSPSVAVGSDGGMYFVDSFDGAIIRVDPTSGTQSILRPSVSIQPTFIVAAADGNLYFSDNDATGIWQLTVAGQFTLITATQDFQTYNWMTAGPPSDNSLWLVDSSGNIDRFSLSSLTLTSGGGTTLSGGAATSIVAGTDGNLYATVGSGIVKFAPFAGTTIGTETTFTTTLSGAAQGIAAGVDGAIWYAVPSSNALVRQPMSTPGTYTKFNSLPGNADVPWDVAIGHDGSIWYVDQTNSAIGHLVP